MQISPKQKKIATSFLNDKTYQAFDGSVRSGKSKFGTYAFADGTLLYLNQVPDNPNEIHDNQHIVMGKSFRNIRETIEPYLLEKYHSFGIYPAITQFGMMMQVNGKLIRLLYFGAYDKGSIASIQGLTARSMFADEVPVLDRDTFEMGVSRTLTYTDAKIYMTSNPAGPEEHWYFQKYLLNPNTNVIHLTMYDNPILSPESIERIASTFTQDMYKRKVLGLWVAAEGACYPVHPKRLTQQQLPTEFKWISIGLDEGRKDATTAVAWGIGKDKKWYAIDQYYNKKSDKNINSVVEELIDWLNAIAKNYPKTTIHFYAETNPGQIKPLLQIHPRKPKQVVVRYVKKKMERDVDIKSTSAVLQRIDVMNLMIGADKVFIGPKCDKLYSAITTAIYDDKGARLDDGTTDIDSLDAAEYGFKRFIKNITGEIYAGLK